MSRFLGLLALLSIATSASAVAMVGRDGVTPPAFAGPDGTDVSLPSKRDFSAPALPKREVSVKKRGTYTQVFAGTGTGPTDRDASVVGDGFMTSTRFATHDLAGCEAWCDQLAGCAFINLFDEHNTDSETVPNYICAAYAIPHTAAEKTNFGGQQRLPPPAALSYTQNSEGWTSDAFANPPTPDGYTYVFGPTNGANQADNFLAGHSLDTYDTNACAQLCNAAAPNPQGLVCNYFNIWEGVDGGHATFTCAMYGTPTDESTATNHGPGSPGMEVTNSRGYARVNLITDGGFESYNACNDFCFDTSDANWQGSSPAGGTLDATIFFYQPYAHTGHGVALLGSATGQDTLSGTLTYNAALNTVAGKTYAIGFWQNSAFSGPTLEASSHVEVQWNGVTVATFNPGFSNWEFLQTTVTAAGNDQLAFFGGIAPAWSFIDDVTVYLA